MGDVMIICPHCGRQIATGLQAKTLAFSNFRFSGGEVFCPHCKNEIRWAEKDVFLDKKSLLPLNLRIYTSH